MTDAAATLPARRPTALIAVGAIVMTAILGLVAGSSELKYIDGHSFFYDSGSYIYQDTTLAELADEKGRLTALLYELRTNNRYPLRTVPLTAIAPDTLRRPLAHLVTGLPALATFLFLLGLYVYRLNANLVAALASMALFSSIPGLLSPTLGIGAYLLDLPAAMFTGAAMLCLLCSNSLQNIRWVAGSGLLAAAAVLSRYTAVVFVIAIIAATVGTIWAVSDPRVRLLKILRRCLPLIAVFLAAAGPFLIFQYSSNFSFYSQYGYALRHPFQESVLSFITQTAGYLRMPGVLILFAVFALGALGPFLSKDRSWSKLLPVAIPALAAPFVLTVLLGASGHNSAMLYSLPSLFLVAILPINLAKQWSQRLRTVVLCVSALLLAIVSWTGLRAALEDTPAASNSVVVAQSLSKALHEVPPKRVCSFYLDPNGPLYILAAVRAGGNLCAYAGSVFFYDHARGWDVDYPGMSESQIAVAARRGADRWVDIAVVPMSYNPDKLTWLTDNRSRKVAAEMSRHVSKSPKWRRLSIVDGGDYGPVAIYENTVTRGRGYPLAIRHSLTPQSKID